MNDAPRELRPPVGIVGIGNMGLGMALRLLDRGYPVGVRDLVAEREQLAGANGASVHADAAAVGHGRELLIVAVVDALQTEQVLFGEGGAVQGLSPGSTVLLCPTLAPQTVQACAARLAGHGIDCIDAPMSGGPLRARDGTMSLMVACADIAFERWQPLLRELSSRLFRIGTQPGDGARTKLVNNLLAAINLAGAAEALALAQQIGLDPVVTLAVIEQSSGQSWIGSDRLRRALAADPAVHAHMALLAKDSDLAMGMATDAGLRPRLGQDAAALFARACADGLAGHDDAAMWRWLLSQPAATGGAAPESAP
jgi:3-hydroxyisobutyrate dehydrogenase